MRGGDPKMIAPLLALRQRRLNKLALAVFALLGTCKAIDGAADDATFSVGGCDVTLSSGYKVDGQNRSPEHRSYTNLSSLRQSSIVGVSRGSERAVEGGSRSGRSTEVLSRWRSGIVVVTELEASLNISGKTVRFTVVDDGDVEVRIVGEDAQRWRTIFSHCPWDLKEEHD